MGRPVSPGGACDSRTCRILRDRLILGARARPGSLSDASVCHARDRRHASRPAALASC